jgi:hypothetical protein
MGFVERLLLRDGRVVNIADFRFPRGYWDSKMASMYLTNREIGNRPWEIGNPLPFVL